MKFHLNWSQNGNVVRGFDTAWHNGLLHVPLGFPGQITQPQEILLTTSAQSDQTYESLKQVSFYLTGNPDDIAEVQTVWPYAGGLAPDNTHLRPDLDGGLELSFDSGRTWTRFAYLASNADGGNLGWESDPSTWLELPAESVGLGGADGVLEPFDTATLLLRLVVPPSAVNYHVYRIALGVGCDII